MADSLRADETGRRTTILAVDDTEANRFVVRRILEEAGYRVIEAGTGRDALRLAAEEQPELVILDVHLPDLLGFDVAEELKRAPATATLPILLLSASFTTVEARAHGLEHGGDAYLTHPVEPPVLVATVRALLRGRRAEEALRAAQERFEIVQQAVDLGLWFCDLPFGVLQWNTNVKRHFGLPADAVVTIDTFFERLHPDDRERTRAAIEASIRTHGMYEIEYRTVAPPDADEPGMVRWIRAIGRAFYDTAGVARRFDGITIDVTERHRAEDRERFLARASETLANALDIRETLRGIAELAVPELARFALAFTVDEDGALHPVVVASAVPEKRPLLEALIQRLPTQLRRDRHPFALALRAGTPELQSELSPEWAAEVTDDPTYQRLLRELAPTSVLVVPLMARGRAVGALLFTTDAPGARIGPDDVALAEELARRAAAAVDNALLFEEVRRARAQAEDARAEAEAANRAKSEFLATMSHELRTPLNAIAGYVELIEMGIRGPVTETQQEDLRRIRRSQQHLLSLINDVLNFAKLEAGHVEYDLNDVPVADLLESIHQLIEPQLQAKELTYERVPCASSLVVRVDAEKTQQILLNLLSNAVKFTPPGGRVIVDCDVDGSLLRIRVHDTGRGIARDKLESIFEPFVQVDRRLARESEGIGLGLSISRNLARAMGGELTATSSEGGGSTFVLALPLATRGGDRRVGDGARGDNRTDAAAADARG